MATELPDITEEVLLGRTLLEQGHLGTAQRVLVQACQRNPDHAEALRCLGELLHRKGDETRARALTDYAEELAIAPEPPAVPKAPQASPPPVPLVPGTARATPPHPLATAASVSCAPALASSAPLLPLAGAPALPSPVAPPAKRRGGGVIVFLLTLIMLGGGGWWAYRTYFQGRSARLSPGQELDRALSSGSLDALMQARDRARVGLAGPGADADGLVKLALVNALLCTDYGMDASKEAEEALLKVVPGAEPRPKRAAQMEAIRALLALSTGDRPAAAQRAEAALAAAPSDPPALALLAAARVDLLAGQTDQAAARLDRALAVAPNLAVVVHDWAAVRLESGDPAGARRVLLNLLAKSAPSGRASVLLADAERALGEAHWAKNLEPSCHDDVKLSRTMRAACALESAFDARLEGERNAAIRRARSAVQASDDPVILAGAALVLAGLGDVDAAADALAGARKYADEKAAPLAWADLAIRLGRNQADAVALSASVGKPSVPERHMVALRAAYASGGTEALAAAIMNMPPALADLDPDLRVFGALGQGTLSRGERVALEKRAERGNPVAAFVLGTLLHREGDFKVAARRLERALSGHGDACQAGVLYVSSLQSQPRPSAGRPNLLRALHGRNAQCPLPEM